MLREGWPPAAPRPPARRCSPLTRSLGPFTPPSTCSLPPLLLSCVFSRPGNDKWRRWMWKRQRFLNCLMRRNSWDHYPSDETRHLGSIPNSLEKVTVKSVERVCCKTRARVRAWYGVRSPSSPPAPLMQERASTQAGPAPCLCAACETSYKGSACVLQDAFPRGGILSTSFTIVLTARELREFDCQSFLSSPRPCCHLGLILRLTDGPPPGPRRLCLCRESLVHPSNTYLLTSHYVSIHPCA